jgi:hypothetical protein
MPSGVDAPVGGGRARTCLAETILRFQCIERAQVGGEVEIDPSQSSQAGTGRVARRVAVGQFPGACLPGGGTGAGEFSRMGVEGQGEATRDVWGGLARFLTPLNRTQRDGMGHPKIVWATRPFVVVGTRVHSGWISEAQWIIADLRIHVPLLRIDEFLLHNVKRIGRHEASEAGAKVPRFEVAQPGFGIPFFAGELVGMQGSTAIHVPELHRRHR